jgi:nucleoside-diphosphate-sugar epimerase
LVTAALGQIGEELVPALRERYGAAQVVASDLRMRPAQRAAEGTFAADIDATLAALARFTG